MGRKQGGREYPDAWVTFRLHGSFDTEGGNMGMWDSVRTAVDRVTGSSATIVVDADKDAIRPGETMTLRISVKNGPAPVDARALLVEIEGLEVIDLPRYANWANIVEDVASAAAKPGARGGGKPPVTRNSTKTCQATVTVSSGLSLSPGEERKFQGTFRLPANAQPTYEGKYAKHVWRMRARLDVLGTDPDTGWRLFRVMSARQGDAG